MNTSETKTFIDSIDDPYVKEVAEQMPPGWYILSPVSNLRNVYCVAAGYKKQLTGAVDILVWTPYGMSFINPIDLVACPAAAVDSKTMEAFKKWEAAS